MDSYLTNAAALAVVALSLCCNPVQADMPRRAATVDDLLRIEGIEQVRFLPDRQSIILEYMPPYDERGQYGIDRGGQILRLPLSAQKQPTLLFEHRSGEKYWLGNSSPDGQRIVVFLANRHHVRLAVFDFQTDVLTPIDEAPQLNDRFENNDPIWINDHEIVFSARPTNGSQYEVRQRPYVADRTFALQQRAFVGETSVASVSTKPQNHWYGGVLLRYNTLTKKSVVLGRGRFGDFTLNTDRKRLAVLRLGQRLLRRPVDRLTDFIRFDTQVAVIDLADNQMRTFLPNTHVSIGSLRWSSGSSRLSLFAWGKGETAGEGSHHVLDADSGSITPIRIEGFTPSGIGAAKIGPRVVPIAAEWIQNQLIVHGVRESVEHRIADESRVNSQTPVHLHAQWFRIHPNDMSAEPVTGTRGQSHTVHRLRDGRLLLPSIEGFIIAAEDEPSVEIDIEGYETLRVLNGHSGDEIDNTVVFIVHQNGLNAFGFYDLTQNDHGSSSTTKVVSRIVAWAADTRQVIVRADGEKGTIFLQSPENEPVPLLTFNRHLSEVEQPRWQRIGYRGVDGTDTYSCVLLPYGYNPEKSYPTIVDVYPGTGKNCQLGSRSGVNSLGARVPFHNSNDVLAGAGYLVLRPSNTYRLNYDQDVLFSGLGAQVDAALDALIESGMTDPERIGIWGFSNGSMASLWLASVSNRYKAVIPMFGSSSAYIEYFGGASPPTFQVDLGRPLIHLVQYETEGGTMPHSMGESAIAAPLRYLKSSPLDHVKNICAPVLMVHSDLDSFTTYHYEALFSAMYRLSKPAELVRYYGEGHGLRSPGNIRDFYTRALAFFDKHVAAEPPSLACK